MEKEAKKKKEEEWKRGPRRKMSANGFVDLLNSDEMPGSIDDIEIPDELQVLAPASKKALSDEWSRRRALDTKIEKIGKDEDPEKFVTRKLAALSVEGVRELEFELRFGNDEQRHKAAMEALDRHGFAKNDGRVQMAKSRPPITINVTKDDVGKVPWLVRALTVESPSGTTSSTLEANADTQEDD